MQRAAADRLTVEDYRLLPEGPPYPQLIDGEVVMAPAPNLRHQAVAKHVFRLLDRYVTQHALGEVFFAPVDVYLSEHDVVQPDVLFISNAKRHLLAEDGVHGGPDLVVEIISASNAQLEKRRKRPLYARCGVKEEWLIDPHLEQIHRYDFTVDTEKPVRIVDTEESFETQLLPGLTVSAAVVFGR